MNEATPLVRGPPGTFWTRLVAYLTFPDLLDGVPVHHFVDNKAAIAGLPPRPPEAARCASQLGQRRPVVLGCSWPWLRRMDCKTG